MFVFLVFNPKFLNLFHRETKIQHLFLLLRYGLNPKMLPFETLSEYNAHLFVLMEKWYETASTAISSWPTALNRVHTFLANIHELLNQEKEFFKTFLCYLWSLFRSITLSKVLHGPNIGLIYDRECILNFYAIYIAVDGGSMFLWLANIAGIWVQNHLTVLFQVIEVLI